MMSSCRSLRAETLAVLLSLLPVTQGVAQPPLQTAAEQSIQKASGEWGIMAWSIDRQQLLFSVNANQIFIPASNNKVLTSIWALDVLGPDYRFPTELLVTGPIRDGVLHGDVILRGSGDPAFGYPEFTDPPMKPLRAMAERLRALGVRTVQGDVIGDPSVFDTVLVGPQWPQDTGGGSARYAPRVSGLPFQRNMLWIEAQPNPQGGPALIYLDPPVQEIPVVSSVRTGGSRAWATRLPHQDTIEVKGGVSGRGLFRFGVGVAQPALLTAGALRVALEQAGILVRGSTRVARTPEDAKPVHRHVSMPLSHMLAKLNKESDNFFAEHLWKATVHREIGVGSFDRGGTASALHFLQKAEIPTGEVYQADGSGLSAYNRASPNALVRALVYAHNQPYSRLFHESLAVAADPDGSMRRLYRGTSAAGNLHAKTGYINRVRTLSGFVRARNGELIAFSFLYNGGNTSGARGVQEELGVLLAEFDGTSPPPPAEQ